MQTVGQEVEHVVVVRQPARRGRQPEVTVFRQHQILDAETNFKILFVVRHPVVEQQR